MALFDYFPNYVWNLSLAIALESGGKIGEIVDMCAPIKAAAERGEDAGTAVFLAEWVKMADKLCSLADEDEARGRLFSAGAKLERASLYYQVAERMQGHGHPGRQATYARALESFYQAMRFGRHVTQRVEIPYEGKTLSALWTPALLPGVTPRMVMLLPWTSALPLLRETLLTATRPGMSSRISLVVNLPSVTSSIPVRTVTAAAVL